MTLFSFKRHICWVEEPIPSSYKYVALYTSCRCVVYELTFLWWQLRWWK